MNVYLVNYLSVRHNDTIHLYLVYFNQIAWIDCFFSLFMFWKNVLQKYWSIISCSLKILTKKEREKKRSQIYDWKCVLFKFWITTERNSFIYRDQATRICIICFILLFILSISLWKTHKFCLSIKMSRTESAPKKM